ncbi:NUDIX hydrolase [Actinopolymorpha alba]|uniref:NUDIX hydrolase n=1 Tax=Actinopolymorpha alba TaxID=533267 RepID=UPI00037EAF47|nr:NUDIX hydrolase N-terminal domain-containing protein [Actinopolymorpha alba]
MTSETEPATVTDPTSPDPTSTDLVTPDLTAPGPRLHALAVELAAMAQNGLTYGTDRYDLARYHRMRAMTAEILGLVAGADAGEFQAALAAEAGHATPKVDVRGALVEDGRVLLVREGRDGRWTLPGGWADALDAPSEAVEREFHEEAGLPVRAAKLAAVLDGSRRNGHAGSPWHTYKLFFLVERLDDAEPRAGLDGETTDVGFFDLEHLPELSTNRCTAEQLAILLAHHRDPGRHTDFD